MLKNKLLAFLEEVLRFEKQRQDKLKILSKLNSLHKFRSVWVQWPYKYLAYCEIDHCKSWADDRMTRGKTQYIVITQLLMIDCFPRKQLPTSHCGKIRLIG